MRSLLQQVNNDVTYCLLSPHHRKTNYYYCYYTVLSNGLQKINWIRPWRVDRDWGGWGGQLTWSQGQWITSFLTRICNQIFMYYIHHIMLIGSFVKMRNIYKTYVARATCTERWINGFCSLNVDFNVYLMHVHKK